MGGFDKGTLQCTGWLAAAAGEEAEAGAVAEEAAGAEEEEGGYGGPEAAAEGVSRTKQQAVAAVGRA